MYTEKTSQAKILISGIGNIGDLIVYGNENTRLQAEKTNLNRTSLDGVGTLVLKDEAYLQLQQGQSRAQP